MLRGSFINFLSGEPKAVLNHLLDGRNVDVKKDDNFIRFIAHSGIQINTNGVSLAIDPWLYSSSHEQAKLQGFDPASCSVDFIVPGPRNTISDIASDIILLSHFHTHHSPYKEISQILQSKSRVDIVCPILSDEKLKILQTWLKDDFQKITFHFLKGKHYYSW